MKATDRHIQSRLDREYLLALRAALRRMNAKDPAGEIEKLIRIRERQIGLRMISEPAPASM